MFLTNILFGYSAHLEVIELLRAFNHGDLAKYNALRPQWTTQMDLQANELTLKRKMCLLCLMEMTLDKATNQRVLTFQVRFLGETE